MLLQNYNLKYRFFFITLGVGIVLFIYGLSTLPDTSSEYIVSDETKDRQQKNQELVLNSTSFKLAMGGLVSSVLSLIALGLLVKAKEDEEMKYADRHGPVEIITMRAVEPRVKVIAYPKANLVAEHKANLVADHKANFVADHKANTVNEPHVNLVVEPTAKEVKKKTLTFQEPINYHVPGQNYIRPWLPPNYQRKVMPLQSPVFNFHPPQLISR